MSWVGWVDGVVWVGAEEGVLFETEGSVDTVGEGVVGEVVAGEPDDAWLEWPGSDLATAAERMPAARSDPAVRKRVLRPIRSIPWSLATREDIEIKYWDWWVSFA